MPANRTGAQLAEAFTDAVDSVISKTGSTPATNQELIDVCNAVLNKCFVVAQDAVVESSMSISPTHTATPAVRFKNA
jgi:hypothetical protein